ncbi:TIGR04197 family type VII secretion effector [Carnobacterium divergens]|uniref:TIGR04197 family type VII secretion effector n=1 Tax=Carnobacterium divergens TaxID=2748 RepID=UPI0039AFCDDD
MGVIKSDLNQASSLATELSNATQTFSQSSSISKASATKVLGNQKAALTIDQTSSLLTSFLGALQRDSQNIQSIATDFEATDQTLAKSLFSIN